jgi:hypothetical protein
VFHYKTIVALVSDKLFKLLPVVFIAFPTSSGDLGYPVTPAQALLFQVPVQAVFFLMFETRA